MSQRNPGLKASPEPSGPLPDEVEVQVDDHLHPAEPAPPTTKRNKTMEVLRAATERLATSLFTDGLAADRLCLLAYSIITQLIRMRFRCGEELPPMDRSLNHVKLRAAVGALLKHKNQLLQEARSAMRGVDFDELATNDDHIVLLSDLLELLETTSNRVRTKLAHCESFGDATVRGVHTRARSVIESNYDLERGLRPVSDLISGSAEAAKDTKKLTNKVTEATTEKVMGRVKDAFNAQKNPPPAAPGAPPPQKSPEEILEAISDGRSRSRKAPR